MKPLGSRPPTGSRGQACGSHRCVNSPGGGRGAAVVEEGDGGVHPPGLPRCEEEARAGWRSVARGTGTWRRRAEVFRDALLTHEPKE